MVKINLSPVFKKKWERKSYKAGVTVRNYFERFLSKGLNIPFLFKRSLVKKYKERIGSYVERRRFLSRVKSDFKKLFPGLVIRSRVKTFRSIHDKIIAQQFFFINLNSDKLVNLNPIHLVRLKKLIEKNPSIENKEKLIKKIDSIHDYLLGKRNNCLSFKHKEKKLLYTEILKTLKASDVFFLKELIEFSMTIHPNDKKRLLLKLEALKNNHITFFNSLDKEIMMRVVEDKVFFENLGIRIFTNNIKQAREVSEKILNTFSNYRIKRVKDYSKDPRIAPGEKKEKGYKAIHLILSPSFDSKRSFEVQVRPWSVQYETDLRDLKRHRESGGKRLPKVLMPLELFLGSLNRKQLERGKIKQEKSSRL